MGRIPAARTERQDQVNAPEIPGLRVQDPDGVTRLERVQNGFFIPKPGVNRVAKPAGTKVRQGFLEQGNSNPVLQLVEMIEVFRAYEADRRAIRAQDDTLRRAVNDVGNIRA